MSEAAPEQAPTDAARGSAPPTPREVVRLLRGLDPRALLFGPIFGLDMRTAGRRGGTYWTRAAILLLLVGIVGLITWAQAQQSSFMGGGTAASVQSYQDVAPMAALALGWGQVVLFSLLGASLTGPSIAREKQSRTIDSLMTTPLSAAQIVFGKLAGRVTELCIVALCSAPILLAARVFGGLETWMIPPLVLIPLSSGILSAALGTMFSVWHRRAASATSMGVVGLLLVNALAVVPFFVVSTRINAPAMGMAWMLTGSSGAAMFFTTAAINSPTAIAQMGVSFEAVWLANVGFNLVLAAVLTGFASLALRGQMRRESRRPVGRKKRARAPAQAPLGEAQGPGATERPTTGAGGGEGAQAMIESAAASGIAHEADAEDDASSLDVRESREVSDRPVLWREIRQGAIGSKRTLIIAGSVLLAFMLWLYFIVSSIHDEAIHFTVLMIALFLALLASTTAASSSIAGEREGLSLPILLTAPLTGWQIVSAKFLGAFRKLWIVALPVGLHIAYGVLSGALHPLVIVHTLLAFVPPMALLTATGLALSMISKKSSRAASINLAFSFGLWAVLPFVLMLVLAIIYNFDEPPDELGSVLVTPHPFAYLGMSIDGAFDEARGVGQWLSADGLEYDMPHGDVGPIEFTTYGLLSAAAYGFVTLLVLSWTAGRFNRWMGRVS